MPHDFIDLVIVGLCWLAALGSMLCLCKAAARADRAIEKHDAERLER